MTLIDRAPRALGLSRSELMLDTMPEREHEVPSDRTCFVLGELQFAYFQELLDAPMPAGTQQHLRELLALKAPWED